MPASSGLHVIGLRELQRAFVLAGRDMRKELRLGLASVAEPIRADVERRVVEEISGIHEGDPWSKMRIGVTRSLVYVAPQQRGRLTKRNPQRYRRPKLKILFLEKAMDPALAAGIGEVEGRFIRMLEHVEATWKSAA